MALQQFSEFIGSQLPIPKDLMKQAGADGLTRARGHELLHDAVALG
jgi:hypothetical protein